MRRPLPVAAIINATCGCYETPPFYVFPFGAPTLLTCGPDPPLVAVAYPPPPPPPALSVPLCRGVPVRVRAAPFIASFIVDIELWYHTAHCTLLDCS
jgi:hypothetical protein